VRLKTKENPHFKMGGGGKAHSKVGRGKGKDRNVGEPREVSLDQAPQAEDGIGVGGISTDGGERGLSHNKTGLGRMGGNQSLLKRCLISGERARK